MRDLTFTIYFRKKGGVNFEIDHLLRLISVYDINKKVVGLLYFSNSIDFLFSADELFDMKKKSGDPIFFIYENGHDNKDWLFKLDNVGSI